MLLALTAPAAWGKPRATSGPAPRETTRYFALQVEGKNIGYVIETRRVADGQVAMTAKLHVTYRRGDDKITTERTKTTWETVSGEPLRLSCEETMGPTTTKVDGRIVEAQLVYTTSSTAGGQRKQTIPWPEGALLDEGLFLLARAKGLAPGTRYAARLFLPETLQAHDAQIVIGAKAKVDLPGRTVLLTRMDLTLTSPAGTTTMVNYVDDQCRTLKFTIPMAGLMVDMVSCDRQHAFAESWAPDLLSTMFLTSPRPLSARQKQGPIVYRLSPRGQTKLQFPSDTSQSARKEPDGQWIVTVDPRVAAGRETIPYAGKAPEALEGLKPSRYVESGNPKIIAVARQAVGDTKDAAQAARKLEAFVGGYIRKKDLSVGYASAATVLATREGDCTEHAVLLAALCRAVGIPAQRVSGVAHVVEWADRRQVFAPHAWVRAYIGGQWVHLDAVLGYDAGHIMSSADNGDAGGSFGDSLNNFTVTGVQLSEDGPATRGR